MSQSLPFLMNMSLHQNNAKLQTLHPVPWMSKCQICQKSMFITSNIKLVQEISDIASNFGGLPVEWLWSIMNKVSDVITQPRVWGAHCVSLQWSPGASLLDALAYLHFPNPEMANYETLKVTKKSLQKFFCENLGSHTSLPVPKGAWQCCWKYDTFLSFT